MKRIEMVMPPMGESIFECTVLKWLVKEGDRVQEEDMIIEVATDKIDTEIGSTQAGIIEKFLVQEGETAVIGKPICVVLLDGEGTDTPAASTAPVEVAATAETLEADMAKTVETLRTDAPTTPSDRFYSPLVLSIAKEENISAAELDTIQGSGKEGRVTKDDMMAFLKARKAGSPAPKPAAKAPEPAPRPAPVPQPVAVGGSDTIIEMDRMRKMIASRMVESKQISPHVTSFVESDMTRMVKWRERIKGSFEKQTGEKLTFTPLLVEAVVKAIKQFPMINVQVDGDKIIKKADINIGLAVALPNGNLIVPVIKNADQYSLTGLAKKVNDLANRARTNQLQPDELTGGTYTISNIGSFGNIAGTPIILQPQVAIMAFGVIQKKPAVVETPDGDVIAIRQQMIISHSYDHRVVDGSLGGQFAKAVADNLENMDVNRDW